MKGHLRRHVLSTENVVHWRVLPKTERVYILMKVAQNLGHTSMPHLWRTSPPYGAREWANIHTYLSIPTRLTFFFLLLFLMPTTYESQSPVTDLVIQTLF